VSKKQSIDFTARTAIINDLAPLIKYIASRIAMRLPPHIDVQDLINAGVIGLMDAIEKYDPSKDIKFKTYAEFRIRGAILDELRSMDWIPRSVRQKARKIESAYAKIEGVMGRPASNLEVAKELNIDVGSLDKILSETASVTFLSLDNLGENDTDPSRRNFLEYIMQDEKEWAFYKLGSAEIRKMITAVVKALPEKERMVVSLYYFDELTMKEIGQVLKFTESRVSQIHTKAITRLRAKMQSVAKEMVC